MDSSILGFILGSPYFGKLPNHKGCEHLMEPGAPNPNYADHRFCHPKASNHPHSASQLQKRGPF